MSLTGLRARLEAATPGPWDLPTTGIGEWRIYPNKRSGRVIARCDSGHDSDLIAHAPTDLRLAADVIEAAKDFDEKVAAVAQMNVWEHNPTELNIVRLRLQRSRDTLQAAYNAFEAAP